MKRYVNNEHANEQINIISRLVNEGLSDSEISLRLAELGYKNLAAEDGAWTISTISGIRKDFRLDAEQSSGEIISKSSISADAPKACKKCGFSIPENSKFCPSCGTTTASQSDCYRCGMKLSPTDSFCSSCGAETGGSAAASQISGLILSVFPNLSIKKTATREEFWASQIKAIILASVAGFVALLVSDAALSSWQIPQLISNIAFIYTYIRICGHIVNGRLVDTGMVTFNSLKSYGVYFAIAFALSSIVFVGAGRAIQIILSLLLLIVCGFVPSKHASAPKSQS